MTMPTYSENRPPRSGRSMTFRMVIMLVAVGAIAGGLYGFHAFVDKKKAEYFASVANPAQVVSTTPVSTQSWQASLTAVGSLRAVNGTDLAFETSGIVDTLNFNSGDDVKAGTVLATLRPDDTTGKLDSLKAQENLAEITVARDEKQFKAQAVAQATLDADNANLKNLKAQLAQQQALIDERTIRAPFAGHLGIRQVDLGQYVSPGTVVVTLQALDPIYADFYLPQQSLQALKLKQAVSLHIDAYPDRTFDGQITAINPKVDATNRNIQIRATLKNPKHELLPGMYGTVEVAASAPQDFLTVPQTAITFNPYGNTVFVVTDKDSKGNAGKPGKDGKPGQFVKQTFVTTGQTRGDQVQILKGLAPGDVIVTSGQTKLHNDTPITINDKIQPNSDANPTPQDQ
jgi:membrane fusion protein (multidrug efflux system)